ncbi:MAG: nitrate reductase molybdenum cofactor assembly chaperone [Beijerinckiaceae bacterium]|nr:nitrate reductase molybdenum cofactor assembly chaperone [Beijerinckiaceae bacterium]
MKTLRILSALLTYPDANLLAALPEFIPVLEREAWLPASERKTLAGLINTLAASDPIEAQERYILLFDRTRSLSLHLFEHVHGESRDRGQAMVDLIQLYEEGGFTPTTKELPDFLPLFLEFASTRQPEEARDLIQQPLQVMAALRERLAKRGAIYLPVFDALLALARVKPDAAMLERLLAEPDPEPDDLEALDAAWEEEEVRFGPAAGSDGCGHDSLASKLRQARRPAPGLAVPDPASLRPAVTTSTAPRR